MARARPPRTSGKPKARVSPRRGPRGHESSLADIKPRDVLGTGIRGALPSPTDSEYLTVVRAFYDEFGSFGAVVDNWVDDTWAEGWSITGEGTETWAKLAAEQDRVLSIRTHLAEGDVEGWLGGIGGVYFILTDDTGEPDQEPSGNVQVRQILVVGRDDITGAIEDDDPASPRYREPKAYKVKFKDGIKTVHWQRLLLVRERKKKGSCWEGVPRGRALLRDIILYENVKWASGEGLASRAASLIVAHIDPKAKAGKPDIQELQDNLERVINHLTQKYIADGHTLEELGGAGSLPNPLNHAEVAEDAVSVTARQPKHLWKGSAAGELAAAQEDTRRWAQRISRRQENWASTLVREYYQRLVLWGVLPEPPRDWAVKWRSILEPTLKDLMEIERIRSFALHPYINGSEVAPPKALVEYEPAEFPRQVNPVIPPLRITTGDPAAAAAGAGERARGAAGQYASLAPVVRAHAPRIGKALDTWRDAYVGALMGKEDAQDDARARRALAINLQGETLEPALLDLYDAAARNGGLTTWEEMGADGVFRYVDDTHVRHFKTVAKQVGATRAAEVTTRIRRSLSAGLARGETTAQLVQRVEGEFAVIGRANAERIARSESIRAYSVGGLDAMKQAGVAQWEWRSTDGACKVCGPLDGQRWSVSDQNAPTPVSDTHPDCRCQPIPVAVGP